MTNNVITFVPTNRATYDTKVDKTTSEDEKLIEHVVDISAELMDNLLDDMACGYSLEEFIHVDSPELQLIYESIVSYVGSMYNIDHPLQNFAKTFCVDEEGPISPANDSE
jgi:hypothetical protein